MSERYLCSDPKKVLEFGVDLLLTQHCRCSIRQMATSTREVGCETQLEQRSARRKILVRSAINQNEAELRQKRNVQGWTGLSPFLEQKTTFDFLVAIEVPSSMRQALFVLPGKDLVTSRAKFRGFEMILP